MREGRGFCQELYDLWMILVRTRLSLEICRGRGGGVKRGKKARVLWRKIPIRKGSVPERRKGEGIQTKKDARKEEGEKGSLKSTREKTRNHMVARKRKRPEYLAVKWGEDKGTVFKLQ